MRARRYCRLVNVVDELRGSNRSDPLADARSQRLYSPEGLLNRRFSRQPDLGGRRSRCCSWDIASPRGGRADPSADRLAKSSRRSRPALMGSPKSVHAWHWLIVHTCGRRVRRATWSSIRFRRLSGGVGAFRTSRRRPLAPSARNGFEAAARRRAPHHARASRE